MNLNHPTSSILEKIFKAYDVRGIINEELTPDVAYAIGGAFALFMKSKAEKIIVGHDMRDSSPLLAKAFSEGVNSQGLDVIFMGLCSTDANYFASGIMNVPSAMITASHNPAEYNGIKMCSPKAKALSRETGLQTIKQTAELILTSEQENSERGETHYHDFTEEYAVFLRSMVNLDNIKPLKIVVDAANGMGGFTTPAVLGDSLGLNKLPIEIIPMYFELDGSFPNHEANPLDVKNLKDLQERILTEKADLGLAFDGDGDRCFIVDNKGEPVTASTVATIIAKHEIDKNKIKPEPMKVLYSLTCSRSFPEFITSEGAEPIRVRVGHSFAKAEMAKTGAIFGGEHSGHFYFKDLWGADSGMLAALHVIQEVGTSEQTMNEISTLYSPYFNSGEINIKVDDTAQAIKTVEEHYKADNEIDYMDGLFIQNEDGKDFWWASLRASNTEPVIRLNVESSNRQRIHSVTKDILKLLEY